MDEQDQVQAALERRREISRVLRIHCDRFSRMGLALAAVVGAQYVIQLCAFFLVGAVPELNHPLFIGTVGLISSYGVGFALFIQIIRTVPKSAPAEPKSLRPGQFVQVFFISVAGLYLFNFVTTILLSFFDSFTGHAIQNPVESMESFPVVFNLIQACIVAPICEELMFRKFLMDRLRPYGGAFAVAASAVAFGMLHGNLHQFFYAFALGCVFGYVALWTGRVRETIVLHALINFISAGLLPLVGWLEESGAALGEYAMDAFSLCTLGGIVLGIYFFHRQRPNLRFYPNAFNLKEGQPWRLLFGSPGFLLFTVLCAAEAVLFLLV